MGGKMKKTFLGQFLDAFALSFFVSAVEAHFGINIIMPSDDIVTAACC